MILRADIMTAPGTAPVRVEVPADEVGRYHVARREPSGWVSVEERVAATPGPLVERVAATPGPLVERLARRVRAWRILTSVRSGAVLSMVTEDQAVTGKVDSAPILSVDDGLTSVLITLRLHTGRLDVVGVPVTHAERVLATVATDTWTER
ncbi:hypothetical protein [Actinomyces provencensis]|uniref:hypothetical protein n=1 Tax=Actinomyces provencensis TaxID=1720198 RepID=UPI0012B63D6E|nr:hypothetical protein [Actinomyces provencensis]